MGRQNVEDSFSILWAWMFIIGTPLVVSAGLINIYSMVWFTIRDCITKAPERSDEYRKMEENKENEKEEETENNSPKENSKYSNKAAVFFSLDIWLIMLSCLLVFLHIAKTEEWRANPNSVQLFIGDGRDNMYSLQEKMTNILDEVNNDLEEARLKMLDGAVEITKYDEEIQDIILTKIDNVPEKAENLVDVAQLLTDYMTELDIKIFVINLSLAYFAAYIITTWILLKSWCKKVSSSVGIFVFDMLGHIIMFLVNFLIYAFCITPIMREFHPDAGLINMPHRFW